MEKKCSQCTETKDIELFHRNRREKDGHQKICIECAKKNWAKQQEKKKGYNYKIYQTLEGDYLCHGDKGAYLIPGNFTLEEIEKMLKVFAKTNFRFRTTRDSLDLRKNNTFRTVKYKGVHPKELLKYECLIDIWKLHEQGFSDEEIFKKLKEIK